MMKLILKQIVKTRKLSLTLALFFIGGSLCYATPATDLATLLDGVHTMQADFTQTVYDNHHKPVQKSYGRMALARPGKFRWEVKKPIPQLIVANDTRLWIYDPDLEQVTIRALHKATGESPAMLLSQQNASIDKDYSVTLKAGKSDEQRFVLAPRNADSMLSSIQMTFINKQLHDMQLDDHLGHTTQIQFSRVSMNTPLAASLFTFKKPANADVIDETKHT